MKKAENQVQLSDYQQWGLIVLRIIIGWHFLYEGIVKLPGSGWSAESYLANTHGFLSGTFHAIASDPVLLQAVNFMNIWGLILIGSGLLLGILARTAAYAGILLLFFYYAAYPPVSGYNFGISQEGHYLLFDKTFIELTALIVLSLFPGTLKIGLWNLLKKMKFSDGLPYTGKKRDKNPSAESITESRRTMLKHLAFLPFLGAGAWAFASNRKYTSLDAFSGSTFTLAPQSIGKIEGKLPVGTLARGKPPVSRLILGGNILSGTAHARDLVYARSLFRAYNDEKKIIETYTLAEMAGINLFYLTPLLSRYRKISRSDIQTMVNVDPRTGDVYNQVDKAIDQGVDYIFIMGASIDQLVREENFDLISKTIGYIKQQGCPAGLGAHSVQALIACDEAGIEPDFYYKTMHHDRYWSAIPKENRHYPTIWKDISEDHNQFHDNMWCLFPEKTVEYIQNIKKPVIGFKVLAAGAIHPKEGFQWAFDNGADFIDVGMFDFQIVEDVNLVISSVEKAKNRTRPWFG